MRKYRHGDLLLISVEKVFGKKLDHLVLAEGEVTFHKHEVIGDAELFEKDGVLYLQVHNEARLTHPEHNSIKIPKGAYLIEHQREYAPDQTYRRERRVRD